MKGQYLQPQTFQKQQHFFSVDQNNFQNKITMIFSNFSCRFLNPYNFFQLDRRNFKEQVKEFENVWEIYLNSQIISLVKSDVQYFGGLTQKLISKLPLTWFFPPILHIHLCRLGSSLHMKIQIRDGKITENLGFKCPLRNLKIFCSFLFSFSNPPWKTVYICF